MNFLEKLECLMDRYGLNKRTLSQNSDIPYTTIDGWYKKGYEGLKLTTLRKLADYFNTAIDYWVVDDITDPNYGKAFGFTLEYAEMDHIQKYRVLDEHGKEMVDSVLDIEARRCAEILARQQAEDEATELEYDLPGPQENLIEIRFYPQRISAGYGEWLDEMDSYTIQVPDTPTTRRADFCLKVEGDSMEPRYSNGDLVFVKEQEDVEVGEYGIWIVDGYAYLKKRGEDKLISINPDYDDIEQGEDVRCVGKVIGKM